MTCWKEGCADNLFNICAPFMRYKDKDNDHYTYLLHAGDEFKYYREENRPVLDRAALKEINESASYKKVHPTNDETWNSWTEEKREQVKAKLTENDGIYIECVPGPLRSEPGLVGIWVQEPSGGWRQTGIELLPCQLGLSEDAYVSTMYRSDGIWRKGVIEWRQTDIKRTPRRFEPGEKVNTTNIHYIKANIKEYGIEKAYRNETAAARIRTWTRKHPRVNNRDRAFPITDAENVHMTWRYMTCPGDAGLGTERTCRCLVWNKKPYKSAFYTPEETAYLVNTRATFNDLLDCSIVYADDETRRLLDIPVVDYMFMLQHPEYPNTVGVKKGEMPSPEWLYRAFGERLFEVMSYKMVPVFCPFNAVASNNLLYEWHVLDDDSRFVYTDVEKVFPHLLNDFFIAYRIAKEYGSKKDEYVRWEEKGGLKRAAAIYQRLSEWVDLCGFSAKYYGYVHYGWVMCLMDLDGINRCYGESHAVYEDGDIEEYAHLAMSSFLIARFGSSDNMEDHVSASVDAIFQVINRPALGADSGVDWKYVVNEFVLPNREKNTARVKYAHLSDEDREILESSLEIMHIRVKEYFDMSSEDLKARYRVVIKNAHPDAGGTAEDAARVNTAFDALLSLKEKYR